MSIFFILLTLFFLGQKAKQINGQQKLQLPNVKTTPFKGQQQQKVQVGTPGGQNQKKFGQKGQPGSQAKQFNQNKAGTGGQQQKSPFNKQQSMNNKKPFTADQKASFNKFKGNNHSFNKNKNRKSFS